MATRPVPGNPNRFYVYVIFDRGGTPRYVGKGCGRRMHEHSRRACNAGLRKLYKEHGRAVPVVKVREDLCEAEAFLVEGSLISTIGRADRDAGPLFNHTDGGDGYAGHAVSERARRLISAANRGRVRSEEEKARISVANKGRPRPLSAVEAQRTKITGRSRNAETRNKISASNIGKHNNSTARRAAMSRSAAGNSWATQKISAADSVAIRERYASGEKSIDLAARFGISQSQVQRIANGKRWARTIIDSTYRY